MDKRLAERIALEGNSVFQDLRLERDVLKEQNAAMLAILRKGVEHGKWDREAARAILRAAEGDKRNEEK